jgi:uncharacterized membrane protein
VTDTGPEPSYLDALQGSLKVKNKLGEWEMKLRAVPAAISSVVLMLAGLPANAQLELCNRTDFKTSVAISYPKSGQWVNSGWYTLEAGQCTIPPPVSQPLTNRYYYFYAQGYDRTDIRWEASSDRDCVNFPGPFDYVSSTHTCNMQGDQMRGFHKIDTDGKTYWQQAFSLEAEPQQADNGSGAALAIGALALLGLAWAANESDKADQEECMRTCKKSRARCVELCTQ